MPEQYAKLPVQRASDPRFLGALAKAVAVTLVALTAVFWAVVAGLGWLLPDTISLPWVGAVPALDTILRTKFTELARNEERPAARARRLAARVFRRLTTTAKGLVPVAPMVFLIGVAFAGLVLVSRWIVRR